MHDANDAPVYAPVADAASLRQALEERLAEYNEGNAVMDLVLFDQVCDRSGHATGLGKPAPCARSWVAIQTLLLNALLLLL